MTEQRKIEERRRRRTRTKDSVRWGTSTGKRLSSPGRGIGRRLATDFAAAGARVVVNDAVSAAGSRDVVEEIGAVGGKAMAHQADIADAVAEELNSTPRFVAPCQLG